MNPNSHLSKIVAEINKNHSTQENYAIESIEKIIDDPEDYIDVDAFISANSKDAEIGSEVNLNKLYKAKSLEQFILSLHQFTEAQKIIIKYRFIENFTYSKVGEKYNKTRQWAEIIERAIKKVLLNETNRPYFEEIFNFVRSAFLAEKDCCLSKEKLENAARKTFGWNNLTVASLFKICAMVKSKKNFKFEIKPQMVWSETDGLITVKENIPTTISLPIQIRNTLREILEDFGKAGATYEEIIREFKKRHPDIPISHQTIESRSNSNLPLGDKDPPTHIIPFSRGTRSVMTTYVLDSLYLADTDLVEKLHRIANEIKGYMKETGLAVISTHNIWKKYYDELQLPELGFYMLMRKAQAGGLVFDDYPRVAYPGYHSVVASYHWALYQYCSLCGIKEITRKQLISFLAGSLGIGERMAVTSTLTLLNLKTNPKTGKYIVTSPNPDVSKKDEPRLFLQTINGKKDFSLANIDWRKGKYSGVDKKELSISKYTRNFFLELQNSQVELSDTILEQLCDTDWCIKNLYSRCAVLSREKITTPLMQKSYWSTPITLGDKTFYLCCVWTSKSKEAFDKWAGDIAKIANINFP